MILFIDQSGEMGGAQRVLLSLIQAARGLAPVTVLCPPGPLIAEIGRRFGTDVTIMYCEAPHATTGRKGVADIFRLGVYTLRFAQHLSLLRQARLIYVNGSRQLPTLLALTMLVNRKVLYHVHTDYGQLEKRAIALAERAPNSMGIISNSTFIADRLGTPSTVVENALDDSFSALSFVDRFEGCQPPFQAAVIGKVVLEKGQDVAARAVAGLPLRLHLIGDDSAKSSAYHAHLVGTTLHGVIQDIPAALDRLGINFNLVPSVTQEAFGLAAIEGMAASCITVVSGRGGLSEIATRTGALVAKDEAALRDTLKRLIAMTQEERSHLARAQYDATQEAYAPARFQRQIRAILAHALLKT